MSLSTLFLLLLGLILTSAFFSSAETSLMSINRYRLRHLVRMGQHGAARRVSYLLERPDKILSVILIGSTCANIFASAVATIITVQLFGRDDVFLATLFLTAFVLIFAEVMPKSVSAMHSQGIAFFFSWPLSFLSKVLSPVVFLVNGFSNAALRLFGVHMAARPLEPLSHEEIRTVLGDADSTLTRERVDMLLGILDLQKGAVKDIMVARRDIVGIDLEDDPSVIQQQLKKVHYSRVPLFRRNIDQLLGVLDVRHILKHLDMNEVWSTDVLLSHVIAVPFIPETVSLYRQLIQFQKTKTKLAFCVDEYGSIQGLVTIHDILEEVVGEFTTDYADDLRDVVFHRDGSWRVNGSVLVRELNRDLKLNLPVDGPKTLSGLVIDYLEAIPETPCCLVLQGLRLEIGRIDGHRLQDIKIYPPAVLL